MGGERSERGWALCVGGAGLFVRSGRETTSDVAKRGSHFCRRLLRCLLRPVSDVMKWERASGAWVVCALRGTSSGTKCHRLVCLLVRGMHWCHVPPAGAVVYVRHPLWWCLVPMQGAG